MVGKIVEFICKSCESKQSKVIGAVSVFSVNGSKQGYIQINCSECEELNYVALEAYVADTEKEKESIIKERYENLKKEIGIPKGREVDMLQMIRNSTKFVSKQESVLLQADVDTLNLEYTAMY